MPTTAASQPPPEPTATANVSLDFPTKSAADAFIDGINFAGDDRMNVLHTRIQGYGQTTVHPLDKR